MKKVSRFKGLSVHLASISGVCMCASSLSNCSWWINQSAPAAALCAAYIRLAVCVSVVGWLILSCFLSALRVPASRPACTGLVCTHLGLPTQSWILFTDQERSLLFLINSLLHSYLDPRLINIVTE